MAERETQVKDVVEAAKNKLPGREQNGGLKKVFVPAAAGLGSLAATYAARKATDARKERVKSRLEHEGGEQAAGGGSDSGGKTRRLPIQRWTDIAAPVDVVYERWTQFDEFPKFMHRVLKVDTEGRNQVSWEEKIWFSRRRWEGEITERRKNDRVAWKTTTGTSHSGVVTFHKLDASLTRLMVDIDFRPSGMIEKIASGLRFVKRAVEADLARFKAYVELGEAKGLEYRQTDAANEDDTEPSEPSQPRDQSVSV
jgi:uncharacterized membrane protein